MPKHTLLVLSDPSDKYLAMLDKLPGDVTIAVGQTTEAFDRLAAEADVALHLGVKREVFREVFLRATRLRWIHTRAAGLDSVMFPELVESPVTLTNGKGVFSQSLGEFVLGAVLFFAKDFRRMVRSQMEGRWDQFDVDEISTQLMGIVGYGDIGRACARRAKAMGMTVLALRRRPELARYDPAVDEIHPLTNLLDVLPRCDYVVAALPLTPESRSLIGEAELAAMKPEAVLINIGRGPVVNEAALVRALEQKRIRGAALDVFDTEPLPAGHPFYRLENVLLSPHSADHTHTWLADAMQLFLDQFERYRKGEPLFNVVEKRLGY